MTRTSDRPRQRSFVTLMWPWTLALALLGPACGTETGNPGDTQEILALRESAALQASAHLLEVGENLEDVTTQGEAALVGSLSGGAMPVPSHLGLLAFRTVVPALSTQQSSCVVQDRDAVVERSRTVSRPYSTTDRQGRIFDSLVERTMTLTNRMRRRDDQPLSCGPGGRSAIITAEAYRVLDITSLFKASVERGYSLRSASDEIFREAKVQATKEGERRVSISLEAEGTTDELHVRQVTNSLEQSLSLTKNSQTISMESKMATAQGKPLVFALKKAGALRSWTLATLRSGTLVASEPSGAITETSFENVVIGRESPCVPESGTITGARYPAGSQGSSAGAPPGPSASPVLTYEINFEAGEAWIRFDKQEARQELAFNLCSGLD